MAHVAASSSPSSDALVFPDSIKFLLIANEDNLLQYTTDGMTETTLVQKIGFEEGSCVALVGNFVYVVGGFDDNHFPASRVVFYDITFGPLVKQQGPSLISPKCFPQLVVMGSKLFAFSRRFYHVQRYHSSPILAPESLPICEFLDTSSPLNKWCPLNSFPILPSPSTKGLYFYSIVSFAVQLKYNPTLFLTFGHQYYGPRRHIVGGYSICYDDSTNLWTNVQPTPLPFAGQGMFVEDLCFGFPCGVDERDNDYVACYKLSVNWEMAKTFTWVTLATYSLLSNSTLTSCPSLFSFFPISSNKLTTIRAKPRNYSWEYPQYYSIELEVLKLLPLVDKKQLEGMDEIIDIHSSHVLSTTSYTMNHKPRGAYW